MGAGRNLFCSELGEVVGEVHGSSPARRTGFGQMTSPPMTSMSPPRGLELGPQLVEVLSRVGGHLADGGLELALVLLVELVYQLGRVLPSSSGPMEKMMLPEPPPPPPQPEAPSSAAPASPAPPIFRKSRRFSFLPADTPDPSFLSVTRNQPFLCQHVTLTTDF